MREFETTEKGFNLASTESTTGRNRPTQVVVAGCCFIAVMCAIQGWQNNRSSLSSCFDDAPVVELPLQIELPSVTNLADRADTVFMPYERNPTSCPPLEDRLVEEFSSALTEAACNLPDTAYFEHGPASTESELPTGPVLVSVVESRNEPSRNEPSRNEPSRSELSRNESSNEIDAKSDTVQPSAIERFAEEVIQTPVDMTQLTDVAFELTLEEQVAELQQLAPAPRIAKQVIQADLDDLAIHTKVTRPWPLEIDLQHDQIQQREQQLLDEMIEDFEQQLPEYDASPTYRPTPRPEFDPSAEPIEIEEPASPPAKPGPDAPQPFEPEPTEPEPLPRPEPTRQRPKPSQVKPSRPQRVATTPKWPNPVAVSRALRDLPPVYGIQDWSDSVQSQLTRLDKIGSLRDPKSLDVFSELAGLVKAAGPISLQIPNRTNQVALRQAAYAIARRIDVWQAAHVASQDHHQTLPHEVFHSVDPSQMLQKVSVAREGLQKFRNSESWVEYLLLNELVDAAHGRGTFVGAARAELAQIALDRITDPNLSDVEIDFLKSLGLEALGQELRLWATHPVSQSEMLAALERFELDPTNPLKSNRLANYRKDLYWSSVPSQNNVATALDKHYRNANVRVTINESMINRVVPAVRELKTPVRENILGAQVNGQSRSRARIFVRLLPDRSRLRFMFETRGEMAAQTAATKGPVTLWNRNKSHFQVRKVVVMDQFGARFGRSQAVASGKLNLQGMRTKYDSYPLLGSIVRKAARRQHNQTAGLVRNIFVNRVEEQARAQVDRQIETELAVARQQFENKVFQPLRRMELNPRAVEMQTRQDGRVVVRGRLAADHQLAAFTARPQAYRDSLLSMQIHESAVNNFLQQLGLDGREANLRDLYREIAQKLELKQPTELTDIPENVVIHFAEKAAVRVMINDGKVCLKLRIKSLKPDGERGWSNFEISADYFPYREPDSGMEFYFARGAGIGLKKKSPGGGMALRAIFTKVLSQNRKIYLVNPKLVEDARLANINVTQMEIHNGWIGLSVGLGAPTPAVAVRETPNKTR